MKKKVVIIDDEPWTRDVIVKLTRWQELGLELVGEAADGERQHAVFILAEIHFS